MDDPVQTGAMMGVVADLETITCTHIAIHEALANLRKAILTMIIPLAVALYTVMAWWGDPLTREPLLPLLLLACVIAVAAVAGYGYAQWTDASIAARELTGLHNQVLDRAESATRCTEPTDATLAR